MFVDVSCLSCVLYVFVQFELLLYIRIVEEGLQQLSGVFFIFGDIVDIYVSCKVDNEVESKVKGIMYCSPVLHSSLVGSVQNDVFDHRPFLIIKQPQVVSILTHLFQNIYGMSEPITNANTLQTSD